MNITIDENIGSVIAGLDENPSKIQLTVSGDDLFIENAIALCVHLLTPDGTLVTEHITIANKWFARSENGEFHVPAKYLVKRDSFGPLMPILNTADLTRLECRPKLYKHQIAVAKKWATEWNYRGLYAHDMGLGKTYTAAYLLYKNQFKKQFKKVLVLTLSSVCPKWEELLNSFGVKNIWLRKKDMEHLIPEYDVTITGFESVRMPAPKGLTDLEKRRWKRTGLLRKMTRKFEPGQFDLIIVDESHKLNSITNICTKMLSRIITPDTKLLFMSGTPFGNGWHEAYTQMSLLAPGVFNLPHSVRYPGGRIIDSEQKFNESFCIDKSNDPKKYHSWEVRPEEVPYLKSRVYTRSDFKEIVDGVELPDLIQSNVEYYYTPAQKALFKKVQDEGIFPVAVPDYFPEGIPLTSVSQVRHLFRMIASGYTRITLDIPSPEGIITIPVTLDVTNNKLQLLKDSVESLGKTRQSIIWVNYRYTTERLYDEMKKDFNIDYIYGGMSEKVKQGKIQKFLHGDIQHLISNPQSIGTGLDFLNARTHFTYELTYSAIGTAQARKRSHRIGQTETVFINRFVGKGHPVERKIIRALDKKTDVGDDMFRSFLDYINLHDSGPTFQAGYNAETTLTDL